MNTNNTVINFFIRGYLRTTAPGDNACLQCDFISQPTFNISYKYQQIFTRSNMPLLHEFDFRHRWCYIPWSITLHLGLCSDFLTHSHLFLGKTTSIKPNGYLDVWNILLHEILAIKVCFKRGIGCCQWHILLSRTTFSSRLYQLAQSRR